jgi:hypothetical protein
MLALKCGILGMQTLTILPSDKVLSKEYTLLIKLLYQFGFICCIMNGSEEVYMKKKAVKKQVKLVKEEVYMKKKAVKKQVKLVKFIDKTEEGKTLIAMSNEEFDKMMCKKFPDIFSERNKPMNMTCMCWGFSIGQGWYPLVLNLCKEIDFVCKLTGCKVIAVQVKEKYASLRFYWNMQGSKKMSEDDSNLAYDVISALVSNASSESSRTCEICGNYGETFILCGWHSTLCKEHKIERMKDVMKENFKKNQQKKGE